MYYFLTEQFGIGALSVTHQRIIAITLRYGMFVILKYLTQYFRFSSNNSSVHLWDASFSRGGKFVGRWKWEYDNNGANIEEAQRTPQWKPGGWSHVRLQSFCSARCQSIHRTTYKQVIIWRFLSSFKISSSNFQKSVSFFSL